MLRDVGLETAGGETTPLRTVTGIELADRGSAGLDGPALDAPPRTVAR